MKILRYSLCFLGTLACCHSGWAWGGTTHRQISFAAAVSVPDDMAAWHEYASILGKHSVNPDIWKSSDPDEAPRHYIDLEHHGGRNARLPEQMPSDTSVEYRAYQDYGIVPWIIMQCQEALTGAMQSNDWTQATRIAAAMGHYVGDAHQPLHCTANFDGQFTGNHGIHLRWEIEMPRRIRPRARPQREHAVYMDDPWTALQQWVCAAHTNTAPIFEADEQANWESRGNMDSDIYFHALWKQTGNLFTHQVEQSIAHLASLWYTAWVDAGRPAIPPPPEAIANTSIFMTPEPPAGYTFLENWMFPLVLFALIVVVVFFSLRRQRQGLE